MGLIWLAIAVLLGYGLACLLARLRKVGAQQQTADQVRSRLALIVGQWPDPAEEQAERATAQRLRDLANN